MTQPNPSTQPNQDTRPNLKVLGIVGSPRENGNTEFMVRKALDRLQAAGLEVELVGLRGKTIAPCLACLKCRETGVCAQKDDFAPIYEKMVAADGLIVGSPVYFGSANPLLMALLDRAGYVGRTSGKYVFAGKVGAPIAVARRAGHNFTFAQLLLWFFINDMIIPGSTYWNVAVAGPGGARDADQDEEAIRTIEHFADNLARVLQKLNG